MADLANIEQRLAALEAEVAQLKRQLTKPEKVESGKEWIERVSGAFKDDPVFEEIVRLGREAREADRPSDLD